MSIRHPRRPDFSSAFPEPPRSARMYRTIAFSFLAITILVAGAAWWLSSTHAQVRVTTKRDAVTLETFVDVAKSPESSQLQGRVVKGTFDNIQEFKVTTQQPTQTTTVVVATTTGRVRITNNYSKAQTLVKTTRLLTSDGKLFRINATVTIPSNQTVEVDAYSDQPGQPFAIKTGTHFTIPGLWIDLQKWIFADAITDFTGSSRSGGSVRVVTDQDVSDAETHLSQIVLDQAKKTLIAEANITPDRLAPDCPETDQNCWEAVYLVTPVEKKTNVSVGQEAEAFLAQVKLNITAVYYPKKDMDVLVRSKLKERLPDGRDLDTSDPATSHIVYHVDDTDASIEKARISINASAVSRLTSQSSSLDRAALVGLSLDEARNKLLNTSGVQAVDITVGPAWARRLPSRVANIEMLVN